MEKINLQLVLYALLFSMILMAFSHTYNPDFYIAGNGVTCMCPDANIGDTGTLNYGGTDYTFTKRTRAQLDALIAADYTDPQIRLTCTSGITDMSYLFDGQFTFISFNQDISWWDTSDVTNMEGMFNSADDFNNPLNDWDVSNVTNMRRMFWFASDFNQPLDNWNTSNVEDMSGMLSYAGNFNQSINSWDVSQVTDMRGMFSYADEFNQPLDNWDVSQVTDMGSMFYNADAFNQNINSWDVSNVIDMQEMFANTETFNQPLNNWDVGSVINISRMFELAEVFNQPLNNWDVSSVENMRNMFFGAIDFNQPLNDWDVSNVTFMISVFGEATSFNQPLHSWDVSNVTSVGGFDPLQNMFNDATAFNQDISKWCVSHISTEPSTFSTSTPLLPEYEPRWGENCVDVCWEGTIDTDWNTPGNWNTGFVPLPSDYVAIQPAIHQPVIDAATSAEVSDILLINNTSLDVFGVLKVNNQLINNGLISFKSDANGSGQLDEFNQSITGRGSVTAERFIPARRVYRLLSSSITSTGTIRENWQEGVNNTSYLNLPAGNEDPHPGYGTHITGSTTGQHGFDATETGNKSMYSFDNADPDYWVPIDNTDTNTLIAGEPWFLIVRGDRSTNLYSNTAVGNDTRLRVNGDLHTGNFDLDTSDLDQANSVFNLIGNPFQAIVDYNQVARTGVTDYIYVWDATIGGINGVGGYVSVELPSGDETVVAPGTGISDANQFIAPGQAFFVQNDNNNGTNTTITISENDKAVSESEVTVFNTYPHFYINSNLYKTSDYQNGETASDAIGLRFSTGFSTIADDEDGFKLFNMQENYAIINNGYRSIDKQDLPPHKHEVQLNISNYTTTNYTLTFQLGNEPNDIVVMLKDHYLDTLTELTGNSTYGFSVDQNIPESIAENRFSLLFDNTTLSTVENDYNKNFSLYPNPTIGRFNIKTPGLSGKVSVEISNLLGQLVYNQRLSVENQLVNVDAGKLSTGVYMVKLSQDNRSFTSKLIVE